MPQFEFNKFEDSFHILPGVAVARGYCECCEERAGWMVEFTFLWFSASLVFDTRSH